MKQISLSLPIDKPLDAALKLAVTRQGLSRADIVRIALRRYFKIHPKT